MFKKRISAWRSLVPSDCPGCGVRTKGHNLCTQCNASVLNIDKRPRCKVCAEVLDFNTCTYCMKHKIFFDETVFAFAYKDLGQQLIYDYKIHGRLSLAGLLADILAAKILQQYTNIPQAMVVPVPAHEESVAKRGFSPPAEIAKILAKKFKLKYDLDLLSRRRETVKQSSLGFEQRQIAQLNAYACKQNLADMPFVVVVDDVMTTGATVNSVARTLKLAGAKQVHTWVLARTLL